MTVKKENATTNSAAKTRRLRAKAEKAKQPATPPAADAAPKINPYLRMLAKLRGDDKQPGS
jgi:hypothetical protein